MTAPTADIVLVHADDWSGLYIGGRLVVEGHRLGASEVLAILFERGLLRSKALVAHCDQDWCEEQGRLPQDISAVQWEAR